MWHCGCCVGGHLIFFYVPIVFLVYTLIDLTTVNYLFLEEKKINANTHLVLSIYDLLFGMC